MTALLRFWPHAAALAALAVIVLWFSHDRYQAGYRDAEKAWSAKLARSSEEGRDAVKQALKKAREDQDRNREQQRKAEQEAREQHHRALTEAQAESRLWHERYRKALVADDSCASWSQEIVACPL